MVNHRQKFIEKSTELHQGKYDYSNIDYTNSYTKIKLNCPEHGEFEIKPSVHSCVNRKQGCPKCDCNNVRYAHKRTESFDKFVLRSKQKHGNKYLYHPSGYTKMRDVATIVCPTHGEFKQEAKFHVKSSFGCKECYYENKVGLGTGKYSEDYFIKFPDRKYNKGILYLVSFDLDTGDTCLKIGIVQNQSIRQRFSRKIYHNVKQLASIQMTLYEAYLKEQQFLEQVKPYKFDLSERFSGYTECFKINPDTIALVQDYFGINISIPENFNEVG